MWRVSGRLIDSVHRYLAVSASDRGRGLQDFARLAARDSAVSCISRPADTMPASGNDHGVRLWMTRPGPVGFRGSV